MLLAGLVERVPDPVVIVAVEATGEGDLGAGRNEHLGFGAAAGGEEVAAVDHRRGHRLVGDLGAGARPPCRSGLRLVEVGGLVAHDFEHVAALDIGDAFGGEPFQLDRLHLGTVLLVLARTLRLLVAVEAAGDALGGTVEDVCEGPEQVVEIGFEPGVAEHAGEGLDDPGERRPGSPRRREVAEDQVRPDADGGRTSAVRG